MPQRFHQTTTATYYREKKALALTGQPTTLRWCLGCEWWMRSTGADHRLCNVCKGLQTPRSGVGGRVRRGV